MRAKPGHIAIIGGGTAGWLAALVLQKAFKRQTGTSNAPPPIISVVESPKIPTIGVGEGSTSLLRQVLIDLELDENEFLKETKATIKFGILHRNWGRQPGEYYGPIDDPNQLVPPPKGASASWLHTATIGAGKPIAPTHLFTHLMKAMKSPFAKNANGKVIPVSPFHHAYHFDQAQFGRFLSEKAEGIYHIKAEVSDIALDTDNGHATELHFTDRPALQVDFIIDCTGFRREIISRMGGEWHSYADMLPLNKAMPFWIEHSEELSPFTLAEALSSGWMWNIPTQDRIGCGYVFSDLFQTSHEAQAEIEKSIGQKIEPRGLISIDPGRQKIAWIGNCVAIGLAHSFLEPLEATSIHGTLVQILLLTQTHHENLVSADFSADRNRYNETTAGQIDDYAQFINLHYAGGRTDTPFWAEMSASGITDIVKDRIEIWQREPVARHHFPKFPAFLPHVEEQLHVPVLDGLGLLPREPSKAEMSSMPKIRMNARKSVEKLTAEFRAAARNAIDHKNYLEKL